MGFNIIKFVYQMYVCIQMIQDTITKISKKNISRCFFWGVLSLRAKGNIFSLWIHNIYRINQLNSHSCTLCLVLTINCKISYGKKRRRKTNYCKYYCTSYEFSTMHCKYSMILILMSTGCLMNEENFSVLCQKHKVQN